ncbi:winged helix-turn-helix domain-containing protein [Halapricum salinum]|uniref:ArsR family transcriptional regulator n=1 Tax=Halapricum salinum TaxID=1457250 RepID=A0A4D6HCA2_9EURY|nr:winged helix-turn-helix domain-containing protein [Halapricum salinum]QCC51704.1 ArsR family transcriptional regulator [Halapricum salinum]
MSAHPSTSKRAVERDDATDLSASEFLDLFGDEYTRQVFEVVAEQPRSGRAVAEAADISRTTAYRRLNDLRDVGLVRSEITLCRDGHHREQFEAVSTSFSISLDGDGIETRVRDGGRS